MDVARLGPKLALLLLLATPISAQLVTVSGTFKNPDGTTLTGKAVVSLPRSTVTNTCTTPNQIVSFRQVTVAITNGVLGTLQLYPSSCLSPAQPCTVNHQLTKGCYTVEIMNGLNQVMYRSSWVVPGSSANVTAVDLADSQILSCYLGWVASVVNGILTCAAP